MIDAKLTEEEAALLEDFESGKLQSRLTAKRERDLQSWAAETVRKSKRINIRISERDLIALQRRALEEGIPYQTLVASILHKYVSGSLTDVAAKKIITRGAIEEPRD